MIYKVSGENCDRCAIVSNQLCKSLITKIVGYCFLFLDFNFIYNSSLSNCDALEKVSAMSGEAKIGRWVSKRIFIKIVRIGRLLVLRNYRKNWPIVLFFKISLKNGHWFFTKSLKNGQCTWKTLIIGLLL